MSKDEIQEKFRSLLGMRVGADRVLDLEQKLLTVEREENVAFLFRHLEIEI
jgi:hypothetical protein